MEAALVTFEGLRGTKRKILVLGDMLELGTYGPLAHRKALSQALRMSPDWVLLVGREFHQAARYLQAEKEGKVLLLEDSLQAGQELARKIKSGDAVLVKGSRGMKMESALSALPKWKG
jgi:UDP-N-acetylmuramyl pentapeptide synthase